MPSLQLLEMSSVVSEDVFLQVAENFGFSSMVGHTLEISVKQTQAQKMDAILYSKQVSKVTELTCKLIEA